MGGAAPAADVAAGKVLAEGCAGCHGEDGVSQTALTPSLAGEPDLFTQWQLVFFRGGSRKSEVMGLVAEALSNDDIRNLGAYYAALPPPKPAGPRPPPTRLRKPAPRSPSQHRCSACHGEDFAGGGPRRGLPDSAKTCC